MKKVRATYLRNITTHTHTNAEHWHAIILNSSDRRSKNHSILNLSLNRNYYTHNFKQSNQSSKQTRDKIDSRTIHIWNRNEEKRKSAKNRPT